MGLPGGLLLPGLFEPAEGRAVQVVIGLSRPEVSCLHSIPQIHQIPKTNLSAIVPNSAATLATKLFQGILIRATVSTEPQ